MTLYMTLRPFTGRELQWFLDQARRMREHSGPLHRLVSVFANQSPLAAMLHYVYQLGRNKDNRDHWMWKLEGVEDSGPFGKISFPANTRQSLGNRNPFGLQPKSDAKLSWFTSLWDLLEMIKAIE